MNEVLRVLALSDRVLPWVHSPAVRERFQGVDLILGCGDLPYYYLEYVHSMLNSSLFFVRGNHASPMEYGARRNRTGPLGGVDLHRRVVRFRGLILAGVEGSLRYSRGPFQYTQGEMWGHVLRLVPALLLYRMSTGRFLDVFVTHAPPWNIHDREDWPHRGIKAFRWFDRVFRPRYHFHGHIHLYHPGAVVETRFGETYIINAYGFQERTIEVP